MTNQFTNDVEFAERREKIRKMILASVPSRRIQAELGVTAGVVYNVRRRYCKGAIDARYTAGGKHSRKERKKRERKEPLAPTPIVSLPPPADAKTLMDLRLGECAYPYGTGPYSFCGRKTKSLEHSWCPGHEAAVYDRSRTLESLDKSQMRDHRMEAA